MSLSKAATLSAFLRGVLKGAEECLEFLKGSSVTSTPHSFSALKDCNCSTCLF